MVEMINTYEILVKKTEGMIPVGGFRCRLENNIKVNQNKQRVKCTEWLGIWPNGGLFEHGNEPSVSLKGGECLDERQLDSHGGLCFIEYF
jgi:hypothetical protein